MLEEVKHLGHASIRIESTKIVYIDPFNIKNPKKDADLIFWHCLRIQAAECL